MNCYSDDDDDDDDTVECQLSEPLPVKKKIVTVFQTFGYYTEIPLSTALEAAMTWCEQQSECSSAEVSSFRRMRDRAAEK